MTDITLREKQIMELEIFKYIDKLCNDYGIKYSLVYGSLLGAVRHKGFIPWDVDLDIALLRPEYDKLMEVLRKKADYTLFSYDAKNDGINYFYTGVKIVDKRTKVIPDDEAHFYDQLGVYIDIYAIDGLPNNYFLSDIYSRIILILQNIRYIGSWKKVPLSDSKSKLLKRRIMYNICRVLSKSSCIMCNKLISLFSVNKSKYCKCLTVTRYGIKDIIPVSIMKSFSLIEFEGSKYSCITNYDYFLKKVYGDYMTPLPESEREIYTEKIVWRE